MLPLHKKDRDICISQAKPELQAYVPRKSAGRCDITQVGSVAAGDSIESILSKVPPRLVH